MMTNWWWWGAELEREIVSSFIERDTSYRKVRVFSTPGFTNVNTRSTFKHTFSDTETPFT